MAKVNVLVLRAAGINCDAETAFAWETAGAAAECLHLNRLLAEPRRLEAFQILTIPGGFSYGDDIASGKILANQLAHRVGDNLQRFIDRGGLILGICNGFQVLVRLGLLPGRDCGIRATLALNDSGRYEDRWVHLRADSSRCPFLERGEMLHLPVAHAEGKIVVEGGNEGAAGLLAAERVGLRYIAADGSPPAYPENPNGSTENIAGLTDATGRILGLMPHPERNIASTHRPGWTTDTSTEGDGARLFRRAVAALA